MVHAEKGGGNWAATFILSLLLWGGILAVVVTLGHQLALYVHAH
ncbi:MAG: hypothetical protein Q8R92_01770 [Deltaproteobacteria bacterium]|nr:hypothetical protein [Deltaproteobacteria bacterium]